MPPPPNPNLDEDIKELNHLEGVIMRCAEDTAGLTSESRLRIVSCLRALYELLGTIAEHPVGAPRARLMEPLRKWRYVRNRIADRIRH